MEEIFLFDSWEDGEIKKLSFVETTDSFIAFMQIFFQNRTTFALDIHQISTKILIARDTSLACIIFAVNIY